MIRSIFNTGFSKVISLIIALTIGVIISRVYGTEGKGLITLLILIPTMVATYGGFSLGEGFLYFIGKSKVSRRNFNILLRQSIIIFLSIQIIVYFSCYFFLSGFDFFIIPQIVFMGSLFINAILKFSLKAVLNFKRFNLIQILDPTIIFIGLIIIYFLGIELEYLLWVYVISNIIQNLLIYISVINKLNFEETKINIKQIFNYSYKVHFFGIMNFTEAKFDILLIGYILKTSAVGIYSVSVSITTIFQTVFQTSISTVLYPMLVKSKDSERIKYTIDYFKISFILALLFFILMLALGKVLIITVYGNSFESAYLPMITLLIGSIIKSPTACINSYFKAVGKPEELYKTSFISVTINIILCFVLIPTTGILGAAIASSISYFIYGFIMIMKFKTNTYSTYSEILLLNKSDYKNIRNLVKSKQKTNG